MRITAQSVHACQAPYACVKHAKMRLSRLEASEATTARMKRLQSTGPPAAVLAAPNITQRIAMFTVNSKVARFASTPDRRLPCVGDHWTAGRPGRGAARHPAAAVAAALGAAPRAGRRPAAR